jgi:hypothetical protein
LLKASNWSGAQAAIEHAKEPEYGEKNAVLYYLDLAMVQQDAGAFRESDLSFDAAQQRMEELYTKSITKHAARFVINDTTIDYPGEPFERALSYVFRALNYIYSGNTGEALVDIRKSNIFLTEFSASRRYMAYKDDAFVQYIGSLLYEDFGNPDDARISMGDATKAYQRYSKTYGVGMPGFNLDPVKKIQYGEIVFLHYNGLAPVKVSEKLTLNRAEIESAVDLDEMDERVVSAIKHMYPSDSISMAYPKYYAVPSEIVSSEVLIDGKSAQTVLVEDITAIATKELSNNMSEIIKRALKRYKFKSWMKFITSDVSGRGGIDLSSTEIADTRCWATLPAEIRMVRMLVPPGKHTLTAIFKDKAGKTVMERAFEHLLITPGRRTYLHFRTTE